MSASDSHLHVEIVQVINKTYLIDADGNECKYFRESKEPLGRGHYVVIWPPTSEQPRFDQIAHFHGPYDLALMARLKVAEHVAAFAGARRNYRIAGAFATQ